MSARLTLPLGLLATPWWSQQLQIVLDTRLFESRSSNVTQPRKTGPSAKTSSPQTTSSSKPTQHKLPSFSSFFFFCLCVAARLALPFLESLLLVLCTMCCQRIGSLLLRSTKPQHTNHRHFPLFPQQSTLLPSTPFHLLPSIHSLPSLPFSHRQLSLVVVVVV